MLLVPRHLRAGELDGAIEAARRFARDMPPSFEAATGGRASLAVEGEVIVLPVVDIQPGFCLKDQTLGHVVCRTGDYLRSVLGQATRAGIHPRVEFLAIVDALDEYLVASHVTVRTATTGLGVSHTDLTEWYGAPRELLGVGFLGDIRDLDSPAWRGPNARHRMLHEVFGHQWGVNWQGDGVGAGQHFGIGASAGTHTVMYARPWRQLASGLYGIQAIEDAAGDPIVTFHPWLLYQAGIVSRNEVSEEMMVVTPDHSPASRYDLVVTSGTHCVVYLEDITRLHGDRRDIP
jgi:hypothetical protein